MRAISVARHAPSRRLAFIWPTADDRVLCCPPIVGVSCCCRLRMQTWWGRILLGRRLAQTRMLFSFVTPDCAAPRQRFYAAVCWRRLAEVNAELPGLSQHVLARRRGFRVHFRFR